MTPAWSSYWVATGSALRGLRGSEGALLEHARRIAKILFFIAVIIFLVVLVFGVMLGILVF